MALSFDVTPEDRDLISQIVDRTLDVIASVGPTSKSNRRDRRINLMMDLIACHASGNPLRLEALLEADNFNLMHDVGGISRHIDHETGALTGFFRPRFSAPVEQAA